MVMQERVFPTSCGDIHYWVNAFRPDRLCLIFLPGLTADHRLFDKQVDYFTTNYNILVWDAPGHNASRPFCLDFTLPDKAKWLDKILLFEEIDKPIIVGQSMGAYVGQCYAELFPDKLKGFIAIDSAPLQRKYTTAAEIWLLKRMELIYRLYPWKSLLKAGCNGVALSEYGRDLMQKIMLVYEGDQKYYAKLSGHGMKMLAEAIEADLSYHIPCPALLICGEKDMAGSCRRHNKAWHKDTGIPLAWIADAGHNSNTDQPEKVNELIESFCRKLMR